MAALELDPIGFLRQNALPGREESTTTSTYFERRDGIVVQAVFSTTRQELADAHANMAAFKRLAAGRTLPVLVDMRGTFATGPGVREYYASAEANTQTRAVALLIGSPTSRMIGNFFLTINRPPMPSKLFTDPAEAIRWLLLQV
jgi:hypothetical protein